ncbi:FKBP-type peptidyl-prolyl cis-trans isomerase [Streptomyces sp. ST2-7A]|uniref:FKBP-type peptidyl-prolyl cis-trans isomerase n=1 Tax=Streptomyces sp. ST2-7A TaxID=2907214 RepID=UPI001F241142|nr:FKBP-type peptidyl-prolyl cis-trans isomerase [Streptomyces sp. ST2-7A]MCE7082613.1 FKBP-type peptidyl-prolyl cis-trans isomerase [Streptomyces sp. ST2-7A]
MTPTKRAHRLVAALAVPALLLTAACGNAESEVDDGESATASWPVATVTGDMGEEPEVGVEDDAERSDETRVDVLVQGDGPEVSDGDYLRAGLLVRSPDSEQEDLVNTWRPMVADPEGGEEQQAEEGDPVYAALRVNVDDLLPPAATEPLIGVNEGSRVVVQGSAVELIGDIATQLGFEEDDSVVFVYDVVTVIDAQGRAEGEQAPVEEGMPEVEADGTEPAVITVPEGEDPPRELRSQVLIEGDGPEVEAGTQLIAQYTGAAWSDGEVFDSSWSREAAAKFGIGVGQVIQGWDEVLVGSNVGDRVLLVIPPEQGYGGAEGHELQEETLVFVVDILDAV